jgi:hypothetical protein
MASCVLLAALVTAWWWPRTGPADRTPSVAAVPVGISVVTIVFTVDLGPDHLVAYPIGVIVILAAWLVTAASLQRIPE